MDKNNVWSLVDTLPKDIKAINSKWVFTIKDDQPMPRYKARLVPLVAISKGMLAETWI